MNMTKVVAYRKCMQAYRKRMRTGYLMTLIFGHYHYHQDAYLGFKWFEDMML